jgi:hypothetical protein
MLLTGDALQFLDESRDPCPRLQNVLGVFGEHLVIDEHFGVNRQFRQDALGQIPRDFIPGALE